MIRKLVLVSLLPVVHLSAFFYQNKPIEERYQRLQKWCLFAFKILGLELVVKGAENLETSDSALLVSNHQGTVDPLLVISSYSSSMSFVSKSSNRKILGVGKWGELIEIIFFNRETKQGNIAMLRQATRMLQNKRSVLIFPEGTRSKSDTMQEFKTGALLPAMHAKADILPITLNQAYAIDTSENIKKVTITYHPKIEYKDYKDMDLQQLVDVVFNVIQSKIESNRV